MCPCLIRVHCRTQFEIMPGIMNNYNLFSNYEVKHGCGNFSGPVTTMAL